MRAILVERIQLLLKRFHRTDVLQGYRLRLGDALAQALLPVFHQLLIGVLAALTETHPLATFRSEAAHQLLGALHARRVHIGGDQDPLLVPEVKLIHPVQEVGVAIRPTRQAHHALEADGQQGQHVKLSFGNDHHPLAQAAIEVVGDQLCPLLHLEVLPPTAILAVDQHSLLEVIEHHAILLLARLWHETLLLRHLQLPQHIEA